MFAGGLLKLHLALFGTVHYESLLLGDGVVDDTESTACPSSIHTAADQDVTWDCFGQPWDLRKLAGAAALANLGPTMACSYGSCPCTSVCHCAPACCNVHDVVSVAASQTMGTALRPWMPWCPVVGKDWQYPCEGVHPRFKVTRDQGVFHYRVEVQQLRGQMPWEKRSVAHFCSMLCCKTRMIAVRIVVSG